MDTTAPNNPPIPEPPKNDAQTQKIDANGESPKPQNDAVKHGNDNNEENPILQNNNAAQESNEIQENPQNPNAQNDAVTREINRNGENPILQNDNATHESNEIEETPNTQNEDAMEVDNKDEEGESPTGNGCVVESDNPGNSASNGNAVVTNSSSANNSKKKKKNHCVWIMRSSRKSKKRAKFNGNGSGSAEMEEEKVSITPVMRAAPEKNDDSVDMKICLSRTFKAEKVELSDDRLTAGSCKGYRMVRATRGVVEGSWYFEIKIVHLGDTGHTRLGWSNEKGDLQGPVGYDENSYGYRDIDGSKIHKALREEYGNGGYKEGDVIGCYISLPDGGVYAPKPQKMVLYKGQRYFRGAGNADPKEDVVKIVPGSMISFFKNGTCQGVAFKDISGGRYYPAASMYTLPNQSNCVVRFNFGPDFDFFPEDFGEYPKPRPMIEVPYQGYDTVVENGASEENKQ